MEIRWSSPLALARRSLRTKIIAWFFVPTAIILVGVALVNFYAYQSVTEDLVFERDRDLIRLGAEQFATGLTEYTDLLDSVARDASLVTDDRAAFRQVLKTAAGPLAVFDGGLLVIDTFGTVVATQPELPGLVGQDWSERRFFRRMVRSVSLKPAFSDITKIEPLDSEVIIVAVPITGAQGEFFGSVGGMFRLGRTATNAFYGGIVKLRIGGSGNTYLVDRTGRVIYHSDPDHIGADFLGQPVVQQALAGQSGAVRTDDFDGLDVAAGFAEAPGVEWGLVTEESWADVRAGSSNSQRALLLLLALGVVIPAFLVAFGLRRIMRPVKAIAEGAKRISAGDFEHPIEAGTGDEIQDLAQRFNAMATALKESYSGLEQKVADRTDELSESEERYRTLFEDSRNAIFISSGDGKVVDAN